MMNSPLTDHAAFLTRRQFFAKDALGIGGAARLDTAENLRSLLT